MREYINTIWTQLNRMYRIISGIINLSVRSPAAPWSVRSGEICGASCLVMGSQAHTKRLASGWSAETIPTVRATRQHLGRHSPTWS